MLFGNCGQCGLTLWALVGFYNGKLVYQCANCHSAEKMLDKDTVAKMLGTNNQKDKGNGQEKSTTDSGQVG